MPTIKEVEKDELRDKTLEIARRHKASWIQLGQCLYTIYKDKLYKEWGYLTFEAYCAKEIGIRSATAKKLLHSYYFLEKEEPTLLQRLSEDSPSKLPSAESVNILRLLKKRQEIPATQYQRFRTYALEQGKEAPQLRKEVRSFLEESQADPAAVRETRRKVTLKRMITTLKAMRLELGTSDFVPKKLLAEVEALTQKLEAVL